MFLKNISFKYNKNKSGSRLSFIANKYKNREISKEEFLDYVNKEYYKQFSIFYKERETSNIKNSLNTIVKKLKEYKFDNIYDIGAGEGFINKFINNGKITYGRFLNCDPYQKPSIKDNKSEHLRIDFEESIKIIKNNNAQNLITLCSTIHHMTNPYSQLNNLISGMKKNDMLLLAHEPINTISSSISHIIMKITSIIIDFFIKEKSTLKKIKTNKYLTIINSLIKKGIIKKKLTPLEIRRLVDYQVGYKLDYLKIAIPKSENEGYWSKKDTFELLLERNFEIIILEEYPYISTEIKIYKKFINNIFYFFKLNTQYSILAKKL